MSLSHVAAGVTTFFNVILALLQYPPGCNCTLLKTDSTVADHEHMQIRGKGEAGSMPGETSHSFQSCHQ